MLPEPTSTENHPRPSQPTTPKLGASSEGKDTRYDSRAVLEKVSSKLRAVGLPGVECALDYLLYLYRRNRRPNTLELNYTAMKLFLEFLSREEITPIEAVARKHLEAFIEHEQDRGLKPVSVRNRLACLKAFFRYLIEEGVIRSEVLSRCIAVKVPDSLPRAIAPEDIRTLLGAIEKTRNRAMVFMLLRTGMRIGELLSLRLKDIDLCEQKVFIHEARKTGAGRVVYFSADARDALLAWLERKDPRKDLVFYGQKYERLTYAAARMMFVKCLKKAGLPGKGYTIHCLRHTFASELLNAGMRLECLQPLLGHTSIEVTRRYARLTDRTRKDEYFKAMALIEKGGIDGNY